MDVVRQRLRACRFNGVDAVGEHGTEDLDHLPVATGLTLQLALHTAQCRRQIPSLEGRAVAQSAWFARQDGYVMQGIVDRVVAPEDPIMASDNLAVLPAFQPVGVSPDLDRPPDRPGIDRVAVLVEAHEAGLGYRRRNRVEAIKRADIRDQARPLGLEHLPNRLVGEVGMLVRFGVGNAPILEPGIQFGIGFELRPRHEKPLPDHPHLVLDLALLPARRRGAGNRVDQVMPAHLLEAAIVGAVLADEDRIDRRLHVVIDASRAGPAKEDERLVVRVEHHLLRLTRVGPHKRHSAVAQTDMGGLNRRGHAVEDHDLMAPVELVCFAGIEAQRNIGVGRCLLRRLRPAGRIATHGIISAAVTTVAQLFVNPDERQALTLRLTRILGQKLV